MEYRVIDHLLLNVNKGPDGTGRGGPNHSGFPDPGDNVVVSVGDRGLLNILIHRVYTDSQTFMGKTLGEVHDETGCEIIHQNAHVIFSYQKIAGINRR